VALSPGTEQIIYPTSSSSLNTFDVCKDAEPQTVMSAGLSDFMTCATTWCKFNDSLDSVKLALTGSGPHSIT